MRPVWSQVSEPRSPLWCARGRAKGLFVRVACVMRRAWKAGERGGLGVQAEADEAVRASSSISSEQRASRRPRSGRCGEAPGTDDGGPAAARRAASSQRRRRQSSGGSPGARMRQPRRRTAPAGGVIDGRCGGFGQSEQEVKQPARRRRVGRTHANNCLCPCLAPPRRRRGGGAAAYLYVRVYLRAADAAFIRVARALPAGGGGPRGRRGAGGGRRRRTRPLKASAAGSACRHAGLGRCAAGTSRQVSRSAHGGTRQGVAAASPAQTVPVSWPSAQPVG